MRSYAPQRSEQVLIGLGVALSAREDEWLKRLLDPWGLGRVRSSALIELIGSAGPLHADPLEALARSATAALDEALSLSQLSKGSVRLQPRSARVLQPLVCTGTSRGRDAPARHATLSRGDGFAGAAAAGDQPLQWVKSSMELELDGMRSVVRELEEEVRMHTHLSVPMVDLLPFQPQRPPTATAAA
jgi:hypothetical protein